MTDDIDEDALNVLLAEGVDAPTALAGSMRDKGPNWTLWLLLVALMTAVVFWLLSA